MDQEARCLNISSDFEKNWDAKQEMYKTLNRGITLEPKSL
jgi:hypothetical protein